MAVFVSFNPLPSRRPGHAELQVEGWSGDASDVEISIRRNASPAHLDAQGKWGGEQQWLRFGNGVAREDRLVIEVGPAIVDAVLEAKRNASFLIEVRRPGGVPMRYPVRQIPHEVTPSSAAGEAPAQASIVDVAPKAPAPLATPDPIPAPVEAQADAGQATPPPRARPTGAIIGGLLALLVAAGVAAWFFLMRGEAAEPPAKPITQAPAPAAEPAAVACSKESMALAPEMTFVQDCVRDVKDSAAMLAIIQAAREAGKCSIAQRLYANRAQGGDVRIAMAYAQEYDPATYKENACFKADGATAAYWYQAVLEKDKDNAQAQARLKDLPK
ncbi:hypothetical protein I6I07_00730 [Achromobacter deleyi]|uniref:Uncharacterized protein n=1 Tax=Achromobacter deleyi TaxID=1353891 RepID=A0A7T4E4I8_9BURK|nr:hypothetical protein [Achromobacter deleyi]QQB35196.1 hypothetical protein I6I07_00730 [Achromobacter deleyi]